MLRYNVKAQGMKYGGQLIRYIADDKKYMGNRWGIFGVG
jgi:hypothetical protein